MRLCHHEGIGLPWCSECNPSGQYGGKPPVAPPLASPEPMPDHTLYQQVGSGEDRVWIPASVAQHLERAGYRIVDEASAKVLEAIGALDEMTPDFWADNTDDILLVRLGKAELARREKDKRNA